MQYTMRPRANLKSSHPVDPEMHQHKQDATATDEEDPDHSLVHSYPPPLIRRSRLDYKSIIQTGENVAFSYVQQPEDENVLLPGLSSAAACIVLELPRKPETTACVQPAKNCSYPRKGNKRSTSDVDLTVEQMHSWHQSRNKESNCFKMKPVYTHQFFHEERMRGYRPSQQAESEVMAVLPQTQELHESFSYHAAARFELSISVRLSPSCRKSCVVVTVGKVQSESFNIYEVRQALHLSNKEMGYDPELVEIKSEDETDSYETTGAGRKRGRCVGNIGSMRKSSRTKNNQTAVSGIRKSNRKRINHVSSDEEDLAACASHTGHNIAPIAVRRSGRRTVPSQRTLFSIEDTQGSLNSQSSDENTLEYSNEAIACKRNNHSNQSYETPAFTRSMSTLSSESAYTASTGDCCLDGGKMRVETIVKHLSRGLPKVDAVLLFDGDSYSVVGDDGSSKSLSLAVKTFENIDQDYLDEPVGTVIRGYTATKRPMTCQGSGGIEAPSFDEDKSVFVLSVADMRHDVKARQYHDEVEKLAPWYIETADCVHMGLTGGISNRGGEEGDHWKVVYLFEQHEAKAPGPKRSSRLAKSRGLSESENTITKPKYSLCGYMTILFHGTKMVVCQVLILPPYQRSGHGTHLMRAAYNSLAFSKKCIEPISQLDVELPGKAFVCLRDRMDYELICDVMKKVNNRNTFDLPKEYIPRSGHNVGKPCLKPLPGNIVKGLSLKLKITPFQVRRAYELWLLVQLDRYIKVEIAKRNEVQLTRRIASLEGSYKCIVKRSLLEVMRNKLDGRLFDSLTVNEQEDSLEEYFSRTICHYRTIV